MKLSIENFAKIKRADIDLNGITIIAGENDSGKSTVGKVLSAVFSGFHNVNEYSRDEKYLALTQVLFVAIKTHKDNQIKNFKETLNLSLKPVDLYVALTKYDLQDVKSTMQIFQKIALEKYDVDIKFDKVIFDRLTAKVEEIMSLTYKDIISKRLEAECDKIFYHQINSLYNANEAFISLLVQGKTIKASFAKNECTNIDYEISLQHNAIYLSNPYLIDYSCGTVTDNESLAKDLIEKIKRKKSNYLLNDIIHRKNIQQFLDKLAEMIPGQFVDKDDDLYLSYDGMREAINVKNLSVGVKAFAIIKRLLENGWLEENGVLIFDEPEIHVHPKWQVIFAEIIVLLQKHFNMTILLTTHSPYFINALEVYSVKYGIRDVLTAYLSNFAGNMVVFEDVTKNMDQAYLLLAEPFNELEKLRFNLGMDE